MSCCCIITMSTSDVGIIQRFGKYERLAEAGCGILCWPIEKLAGSVSLRVQSLNAICETKTKDNVFVSVKINVQYQAIREKVYSAFYVLTDHEKQMRSYIFDVVRASLTQMTLDQSFESKEEISMSLKTHLQEVMTNYGYTILQALVTDVAPEAKVRDAMNEINASKRLKEAAYERAEGEKILKVKRAEGESESMYLSGVGIARERKAIMEGLKDSVLLFSHDVAGVNPKDIMDLLILNQYFDTIQEVGKNPNTKIVFLPQEENLIRSGMLQAS